GVFAEAVGDVPADEGNEGWGVTGRLTYAPIRFDTRTLHLGAAASYREPDDEKTVKFNTRPESHITDVKYVDTGKIKVVDTLNRYGLEAAAVFGPFSVQGEYIRTDVNLESGSEDLDFNGWYAYASWFITGESRPYKARKAAFGRVKPRSKQGAWELAARYSTIDLNDGLMAG
ncbi:MAG: porin, partial [bacterium]|nr:porin [bacterium]